METLLSTKQALAVLKTRFPGLRSAPQLLRQVKIGALKVSAVHGRKYMFSVSDLLDFVPEYQAMGRNERPPLWDGNGFTPREAAEALGIPKQQMLYWIHTGRVDASKKDGVYCVPESEIDRLREDANE